MATHLDLEEQEQIDQIKHFWSKWGTLITSVVVIVLAAFTAWNGYQYWQQRQALQAAALADALTAALQSQDQVRVQQAFDAIKTDYQGTLQAGHAALQVAESAVRAGDLPQAQVALEWAAANTKDQSYQAVAKLRLAAVLMQQENAQAAAALLSGSFPAEFQALAADRLGDALQLQGKNAEAIAAYQQAWTLMSPTLEYRALLGFKLNALGVPTSEDRLLTLTETTK